MSNTERQMAPIKLLLPGQAGLREGDQTHV